MSAECLTDVLLTMEQTYLYAIFLMQMFGQMLGTIHTAVLTARAAEGEHEVGEATLDVSFDVGVGQTEDAFEEGQYLAVVFEETDDGLLESCHVLVLLVTPWVVGAAAVENVASAIAALVLRNTFLIGETEDADNEWRVLVADD